MTVTAAATAVVANLRVDRAAVGTGTGTDKDKDVDE